MPEISVIVPVYKVEKYLPRCIDSILVQTYADFELILIDDGSPDNCGVICDEYAQKDSRIRVFHIENRGVSAARNFGIEWAFANSDSEWLTFIDSDDWVHPRMFEILYHTAIQNDVQISVCGFVNTTGEEPCVDCRRVSVDRMTVENFYVTTEKSINFVIPWGKLYRKDIIADVRYPVGKRFEDEFTTYRILFRCPEIVFIDAPLYFYYKNTSGFMHESWSPKRLYSLEAIAEQVDYMKRNGYRKAFQCAVRKYCKFLGYNIMHLQKCDTATRKMHTPLLRSKLRRVLMTHFKIISFTENKWMYELAFPRMIRLYWHWIALKNKLFKR